MKTYMYLCDCMNAPKEPETRRKDEEENALVSNWMARMQYETKIVIEGAGHEVAVENRNIFESFAHDLPHLISSKSNSFGFMCVLASAGVLSARASERC